MSSQRSHGFTLLELSTVLAIIGVMLGISVAGYSAHINNARAQEAVVQVHALADLLRSRPGKPVACAASPSTVPRGTAVDWVPSAGFKQLRWRPGASTRFQYEVVVPGPKGAAFEVRARGDLNGDGLISQYRMRADSHTLEYVLEAR